MKTAKQIGLLRRQSKITKGIQWAYPSSSDARRFGFADTGCWTVGFFYEHPTESVPPHTIIGYAKFEEAEITANHWPEPYSRFTAKRPQPSIA